MLVELDIFSGRPNPIWNLDDTDLRELIDRIKAEPSIITQLSPIDVISTLDGYDGSSLTSVSELGRAINPDVGNDVPIETGGPVPVRPINPDSGNSLNIDPDVGEFTPIEYDTYAKYLGTGIGDLGYRGYIIQNDNPDNVWAQANLPSLFRINADQLSTESSTEWLLKTSSKTRLDVNDDVMLTAQQNIKSNAALIAQARFTACSRSYYTSSTDFSFWNSSTSVRQNNNCYNFASNNRTNTFAQPGTGSGRTETRYTCGYILAAAQRDGWQTSCRPDNNYNVCLVMSPNDYHWYRLCSNGYWCHKPGRTNARNTDNSGRLITNPETCNRGPYTQFCGYLRGFNVRIR